MNEQEKEMSVFLGTVLVDQTIEGISVKKKALVVAFEQVVKRVVDKKIGLFKTAEQGHYEVSPHQTRLVLATYRGESGSSYSAQDSVEVPVSFDEVDALLAASAKSGEAVDLQKLRAPANDSSVKAEPQIGDVMPAGHPNAGWIFMGPDDETGKDFYAAPKDESGTFTFNQAARRAEKVGAKMPTRSQLDKMYRNKDKGALKGTFNETGSYSAGWYWSSRDYFNLFAWAQRFSDGPQDCYYKGLASSLRCVR